MQIEKAIDEVSGENRRLQQKLVSRTVALMHQRRKAANHVDDRYFEQELFIEAHEEIAETIMRLKELLSEQCRIARERVV